MDKETEAALVKLASMVGDLAAVVGSLTTPEYVDEQVRRLEGRLEEFTPRGNDSSNESGSQDNSNGD